MRNVRSRWQGWLVPPLLLLPLPFHSFVLNLWHCYLIDLADLICAPSISQSFLCKHVCDAKVERDGVEARPSQQKLSQARFETYFFFFPVNCQKYHLSRLVQLIRSR